MAYTTTQLITGAYYASGVISREFETVSGGELSDGLGWLNDILTEKRVDDGMIPYETKYTFISKPGVETYYIPNLTKIDTIVFYLQQVRYPMIAVERNEYFGQARVENIKSLPYEYYFERKVGGGNLHTYFLPDQPYPFTIHGIFTFNTVILGQNLLSSVTTGDLGVPTFYGNGTLAPGQLVVTSLSTTDVPNPHVDLMGVYPNIGALVNYINTGIIPGVQAKIEVNDFELYSTTEPATAFYVQTNGYPPNGTSFIGNVAAATTSDLNAAYANGAAGVGATLTSNTLGVLVIDGYTPVLGDRILVINQSTLSENGSYILTTLGTVFIEWVLTRTPNYDLSIQINEGNLFTVLNGTVNGGLTFVQTADVSVIGTSPIIFSVFNALTFSNFSTIEQPAYEVYNPSGFDQFYLTYLRYALADRICAEYNYDTPPNVMKQLSKYESWINQKSRVLDLVMTKVSTLQKRGSLNWAQINIGKGYTRPY